jgi:hypothetical protein
MARSTSHPLDEARAMREPRFRVTLRGMMAIVAVLALFSMIIATIVNHDPHPGLSRLKAKQAQMKVGMTVAEVDALMAGHPRRESRTPYEYAGGRILPQPSTLAVTYDDKPGAMERDYGLTAYFDKDGRLMDSWIGEYMS